MKAIDVFRKLIESVYLQGMFKWRSLNEPGALVKKLSAEEREILNQLSAKDISHENVIPEAKIFAEDDYQARHKFELEASQEKLKFDKHILK